MFNRGQPADKLKAHNWAAWCHQAEKSKDFCRLCGWPLDPPFVGEFATSLPAPDRCLVCIEMEGIMFRRAYWVDLNKKDAAHRKNMGLDE